MASLLSRLLRRGSRLVRKSPWSDSADGERKRIESRRDLSLRYLSELSELVGDRRISATMAQQVIDDLFEPEEPGVPRRVRLRVWRSYLKDRTGHIGLHLVGSDPTAGPALH